MSAHLVDRKMNDARLWLEQHYREMVEAHEGKVFAFDPSRGVLAEAPDIDLLCVSVAHHAADSDIFAADFRRAVPVLTGHRHIRILHLTMSSFDVFERAAAMHPMVARLWELARLPAGWDGHTAPPPSGLACEMARRIVERAVDEGFAPSRVIADTEGGIATYWFGAETLEGGSHRKVASLAVDNEGELAGLTEDRVTGAGDAFDLTLASVDAALARLRAFLGL